MWNVECFHPDVAEYRQAATYDAHQYNNATTEQYAPEPSAVFQIKANLFVSLLFLQNDWKNKWINQ